MAWPTATDFIEAVQDLRGRADDEELRGGEVARTPLGLPMLWSGNFADVFKIDCPATGNRWALKCFTREVAGQCDRYRRIAAHLGQAQLPFTVDFQYLEQGLRVGGQWFPALKMRWVEGLTLAEFVEEHLERPGNLRMLLDLWVKLAARLREAEVAHADLQHGNVLLVPMSGGSLALRLIDYDGLYVPSLAGMQSGEVGHPAYQHPQRLREGTYNAEVDRFPHLSIYCGIRCLMRGRRELWQRFNNGDNLLFREADFLSPRQSELFRVLWKSLPESSARTLVGRVVLACEKRLEEAPLLDEVVRDGKVLPLTSQEAAAVDTLLGPPAKSSAEHHAEEDVPLEWLAPPAAESQEVLPPSSQQEAVVDVPSTPLAKPPAESPAKPPAVSPAELPAEDDVPLEWLVSPAESQEAMPLTSPQEATADTLSTPPVELPTEPPREDGALESPPAESQPESADGPKGLDGRTAFEVAVTSPQWLVTIAAQGVEAVQAGKPLGATATVDLGRGMKLEMVLIPPGEFLMGSPDSVLTREKPQHRVRITRPFYLGKYLLTQEQWWAVMGNNPGRFKGLKNPVETVSWNDCQALLAKLNAMSGSGEGKFRLPTEAQWEYACRAGSTARYCFGEDESALGEYAWYHGNSHGKTHPVGEKKPNAWGLYDMYGNVWEWCADRYDGRYYRSSPTDDPTGSATASFRLFRGGSWNDGVRSCRSAIRINHLPGHSADCLGLRLCMAAGE